MAKDPEDSRSALAIAMEWSTAIMTISLEMVLPGLAGSWLDERWNTRPWLTVFGMAAGGALGMWQLIRLTRPKDGSPKR